MIPIKMVRPLKNREYTKKEIKIEAIKGNIAIIASEYGTPTFLPHCLHLVGTAGPKQDFLHADIPGL